MQLTGHPSVLIGRKSESARLKSMLQPGHLVTVVGPPGVGKTALARWIGRDAGPTLLGFATLETATDHAGLVEAVAHAMGIAAQAGGRGALGEHIAQCVERMKHGLVVLDNAEHIVPLVAHQLKAWQSAAPEITWLVTSQAPLGLASEQVFELSTLSVVSHGSSEAIRSSHSVQFLVDRLRSIRPLPDPIPEDTWRTLSQIACQLDGLPLALELAVHRMRTLSPLEVLNHLESRFKILKTSLQSGETGRHDALETTLEWSWSQLPEWAQSALAQCAVFREGFEYAAAVAVVDLTDFEDAPDTLDVLELLLSRSLIHRVEVDQVSRFQLLRCIAAFARGKHPESPEILHRHALHFGVMGARAAETTWRRSGPERTWLQRNRLNLEFVVDQAEEHKEYAQAFAAILALDEILYETPLAHHLERMESLLALTADVAPTEHSLQVSVLRGRALRFLGRVQESIDTLNSVMNHASEMELVTVHILAQADLSRSMRMLGESDAAHALMMEAYTQAVDTKRDTLSSVIQCSLGLMAFGTGRLDDALRYLRESRDLAIASGHDQSERVTQVNLGRCHVELGEFDAAQRCFQKSVDLGALIGHEWSMGYGHFKMAEVNGLSGRMDVAHDGFQLALDMLRRSGDHPHEAEALVALGNCLIISGKVAEALDQYDLALDVLGQSHAPRIRTMVSFGRAWAHVFYEAHHSAKETAFSCVHSAHDIGDPTIIALAESYCAICAALCGDLDDAKARLEESRKWAMKGAPKAKSTLNLSSAFIALKEGDEQHAIHTLAKMRAHDAPPEALNAWFETKVITNLVEKSLSQSAHMDILDPEADLKISGRRYCVAGGDWVDLSKKDLLFRFVDLLAEAHENARGTPIQLERIVEHIWPDEKMVWDAATARVYTAVSTLRRQGLKGLLVRRQGGYLFDESIRISRLKSDVKI